jgi:UDP-glucose 4-epimerase
MKVLVTGAAGFIGRAVCTELRQRGHSVLAAVRWNASNDEVAIGDIEQVRDWAPLLESVDAVIHLAARVHQMHDDDVDAYRRVNRDATAHLAASAVTAGVAHFVFLSSVKVMGEATEPGRPFRETDPPLPVDPYGKSKLEAERELARICGGTHTSLTILRPPLVYGPGVKANFLSLLRAVDRGVPLPFGSIANERSLVSVRNLASAIVHALSGPGGTYFVSDGENVSTPALMRALGRALGKPVRLVPVPLRILRALGVVSGRRGAIDRLTGSLAIDTRRIRDTGWAPPESLVDGLARTAEWYRAR